MRFRELICKDEKLKTCMITAIVCIIANILVTTLLTNINETVHMLLMFLFSFSAIDAASRFAHRYALLTKQGEDEENTGGQIHE